MNRDKWHCTQCKDDTEQLQVHHFDYFNGIDPWDYPLDMLTTLCKSCHMKEMTRNKAEIFLLSSLKMKGFLIEDLTRLSCKIDTDKEFVEHLKTLIKLI